MNHFIWYVAGKSGGHIIPALTHAQQWHEKNPQIRIIFFTTTSSLDKQLLTNQPFVFRHIALPLNNFPRKNILKYPVFIFSLFITFIKIIAALVRFWPIHMTSMGGYVSVPLGTIAHIFRIPFDQYELNAVPGQAVRFLSTWARTTFICFKQAQNYLPKARCQLVAYPLRMFKQTTLFQSAESKKIIVVLGGSQGSHFINEYVQYYCTNFENTFIKQHFGNDYDPKNVSIVHQTGPDYIEKMTQFYQQTSIPATVFAFHADLSAYYQAADLIIARAGAGTLFEIAHFKKKALIIPLETKITDHQLSNAQAMAIKYPEFFTIIRQKDIHIYRIS
ncbi:MAG: UDP-N-acetylglucosamine--N-acetylmuramyl-(pentapeptide) pyrophosphoryl-undecaprenol N-acetylglucosamine transferase [Candidatus Babeliaceae bacterium]